MERELFELGAYAPEFVLNQSGECNQNSLRGRGGVRLVLRIELRNPKSWWTEEQVPVTGARIGAWSGVIEDNKFVTHRFFPEFFKSLISNHYKRN